LANANLRDADLHNVDLSYAELHYADLRDANLTGSNLEGASLVGAHLQGAILVGTRLNNTNFSASKWRGTIVAKTNLGNAKGLSSITHDGPSIISIDTLHASRGEIPEEFLRGVDVPENLITYIKSLTGTALEFYSCFISYSSQDQEFAERLHANLQARGIRCWFAPHDIQGGRKINEQIDDAIRLYDKLLLILSEASMNSNWVETEIASALAREEQQKRQMLFPITLVKFDRIKEWKLFDANTGINSAQEIRGYFIPDFSNWKHHDSYQKAFERLVRDLKSGGHDEASA
jgi:hypothetical protein